MQIPSHYKKVREGTLKDFVGFDMPYEEPENPEVVLETDKLNPEECVNKIIEKVKSLEHLD